MTLRVLQEDTMVYVYQFHQDVAVVQLPQICALVAPTFNVVQSHHVRLHQEVEHVFKHQHVQELAFLVIALVQVTFSAV